jgi:hypothetical protein
VKDEDVSSVRPPDPTRDVAACAAERVGVRQNVQPRRHAGTATVEGAVPEVNGDSAFDERAGPFCRSCLVNVTGVGYAELFAALDVLAADGLIVADSGICDRCRLSARTVTRPKR